MRRRRVSRQRLRRAPLFRLLAVVGARLRAGEATIADATPAATVMFVDVVGHTRLVRELRAAAPEGEAWMDAATGAALGRMASQRVGAIDVWRLAPHP